MKKQNYLKIYFRGQSEFDHQYACWDANHRGWQKMKKRNKRRAKRNERLIWKMEADSVGTHKG